jgi:hypothetical protein
MGITLEGECCQICKQNMVYTKLGMKQICGQYMSHYEYIDISRVPECKMLRLHKQINIYSSDIFTSGYITIFFLNAGQSISTNVCGH